MFGLPIDAELKILLNRAVAKVRLDTLDANIKDTLKNCFQNDFDLVKCLLRLDLFEALSDQIVSNGASWIQFLSTTN